MTLEEASIDQLFDEIASRCTGCVLTIVQDMKVGHDKEVGRTFYRGGRYQAIGLVRSSERELHELADPREII